MPKLDFISKFTFILFGIFITSVIFALATKALGEIGIYFALLVCSGLCTFILIYFKNRPRLRFISYGMITMISLALIILVVGIGFLSGFLNAS